MANNWRWLRERRAVSGYDWRPSVAKEVYYLHAGRAKLTVLSGAGKKATITLLAMGDFVGEESAAAVAGLHMATAVAITSCTALKIQRSEMLRVMHEEHAFSDMFLSFLISRGIRTQAGPGGSALQL